MAAIIGAGQNGSGAAVASAPPHRDCAGGRTGWWTSGRAALMIAVQGSNGVEGTLVDNAELNVSALAKGVAACSRRVTRAGVSGARGHFLALVAFRLPADQQDRIGLAERLPRAGSAPLADAFRQARALPPDGNRPRPPVSRPLLTGLPPHLGPRPVPGGGWPAR